MTSRIGALVAMFCSCWFGYLELQLEDDDVQVFRMAAIGMLLAVTLIIAPYIDGIWSLARCFGFMAVSSTIGFWAGKWYYS